MIPADRLELFYPDGPPPWDAAPDCAAVCIGGRYTRQAVAAYADTGIQIVTLVDWPAGLGKPTVRQIEAVAAAKDGTHAIEIPAPAELLRQGDAAALAEDLQGIAIAVREVSRAVEVRLQFDASMYADSELFSPDGLRVLASLGLDRIVIVCDSVVAHSDVTHHLERIRHHDSPVPFKISYSGGDGLLPDAPATPMMDRIGIIANG